MRKTAAALLGAGAFALGLAVLVPTVISPALLKAPAEEEVVTHSRSDAQKLNIATGELEPITVDLTRKLSTHANGKKLAGTSDVAVYDELINLAVVGPDGDLQTVDARGRYTGLRAGEFVIAFDRSTGQGKPDFPDDTYDTTGQTVKFPFDTKKKTYDYFDQTSRKAWPVDFVRGTKVKGLEVYEFSGTIPETSLGQYGVLEGTDTLYSNKGRSVFVEPVTGSIVSSETAPQTSIKFADGSVKQGLLVDGLVPTDETIAARVADAKDAKGKAQTLRRAPLLLGLVGLLLLLGGLAASRGGRIRGRRDDEPLAGDDYAGDDYAGDDYAGDDYAGDDREDGTGVLPIARDEDRPGSHLRR